MDGKFVSFILQVVVDMPVPLDMQVVVGTLYTKHMMLQPMTHGWWSQLGPLVTAVTVVVLKLELSWFLPLRTHNLRLQEVESMNRRVEIRFN